MVVGYHNLESIGLESVQDVQDDIRPSSHTCFLRYLLVRRESAQATAPLAPSSRFVGRTMLVQGSLMFFQVLAHGASRTNSPGEITRAGRKTWVRSALYCNLPAML